MSQTKVWRYRIPSMNHSGWGIFFLDAIGCFAAITDYGNYTYLCSSRGWESDEPEGRDFRRWFLTVDDGYLADKLGVEYRRWGYVIDVEKTVKAFRHAIIQSRRDRSLTKEQAKDEWDNVQDFKNGNNCKHELVRNSQLYDAWELPVKKELERTHPFFTKLLPRLREAIRSELEAEARAVVPSSTPQETPET
jgi:hypothetical protein